QQTCRGGRAEAVDHVAGEAVVTARGADRAVDRPARGEGVHVDADVVRERRGGDGSVVDVETAPRRDGQRSTGYDVERRQALETVPVVDDGAGLRVALPGTFVEKRG